MIDIRPCRPDDTSSLVELSARTLRASYTPFLGEDAVERWIAGSLDEYVNRHLGNGWLAAEGGVARGFYVLKGQLLDLLLVDVRAHGQGVGTCLLGHAEAQLSQRYREVELESFVPNDRANAFYAKRGWVAGERRHDDESGVKVVRFTKRLTPGTIYSPTASVARRATNDGPSEAS